MAEARRLREVEGLSHRAIAATLGVSKSTVARWVAHAGAVEVA
ncbi:helix-turn-helix domain-containing protein [Cellulomonas sp. KH9]